MSGKLNDLKNEMGNWAIFPIRIALGIIFIVHGWEKMTHIFSQLEFKQSVMYFQKLGLTPAPFWFILTALSELLAGICVFVGLFSRVAVTPIIVIMVVAIYTVHLKNGFFILNGGYEYNIALFSMAMTILLGGGGPASVDIMRNKKG